MVNNSSMDAESNVKMPLCLVCSAAGTKRCSGCRTAHYCSGEHQRLHWKLHKKSCSPYEIRINDQLGRHLVATRDLPERSIIIQELPFAFAPYDPQQQQPQQQTLENVEDLNSDTVKPICLSCCVQMVLCPTSRCSKCCWPICSPVCEQLSCHKDFECPLFSSGKIQFPPPKVGAIYGSILILRLVLLKEKNPGGWRKFLEMEHHNKIRGSLSKIQQDQERVIQSLVQFCGSEANLFSRISREELVETIERVNINSFGVARQEDVVQKSNSTSKCGGGKTFGRGIYLKTGIVSHGCIPNSVWGLAFSPNFELFLRASVPIKKGEIIQHSYNDQWNFLPTYHRQLSTFYGSHFSCSCSRCLDPTEYGTMLSAIKCFHCPRGYFLPENPTDLNAEASWLCTNVPSCGMREEQEKIMSTLHFFELDTEKVIAQLNLGSHSGSDSESDKMSKSNSKFAAAAQQLEESRQRFLQLHQLYVRTCTTPTRSPQLHPHHFLVRCIQREMINVAFPVLHLLSYEDLDLFIWHCEQLLQVSTVLAPGFNRHLANLRNYLCQAMLRKKRRAMKEGKTEQIFKSATTLIEFLAKLDRLQKQVIAYYELDPDTLPPPSNYSSGSSDNNNNKSSGSSSSSNNNNIGSSSLVKTLIQDNAVVVRDIKVNMSHLFK